MILRKHAKNGSAADALANEITFKFLPTLKTFEKDGKKYCRLTASSNAEDLVGDIMSVNALKQMEAQAVGTVMFMNHSTNVPEDVFGAIVEAELKEEPVELPLGSAKVFVLHYLVEVEESNERAVKCWQMIESGKKLGASVTVLVKDSKPNPKRKNGIIIEDVYYLETSLVGIPCNQLSWVYSASKALELAGKRAAKNAIAEAENAPLDNNNGETAMSIETNKTAVAAGEIPGEAGQYFARTIAAIAVYKTIGEQIAAKAENIQIPEVVAKGMFNDILAQEPKLWELFDILCEVKWNLMSQKRNLEYLGQTDFSAILAAWDEALDEFKAAAVVSFKYWGDFDADSMLVFYSLDLQKSFESLAEVYEKSSDENVRSQVRETGEKLLELAKQIGIVKTAETDSEPAAIQIPDATDEQIEKSQKFIELQKLLDEMTENYETAKAGLKVAGKLMDTQLRQPLETEGTPATS